MSLAGGTVLFPYGSSTLRRLRDLTGVGWEPWTVRDEGLEIAATCTIAQLYALPGTAAPYELVRTGAVATPRAPGFPAAEQWPATALIRPCCDSFVASFKIWNVSTVGGNIATALPAGPMTSLFAGLDAVATVWARRRPADRDRRRAGDRRRPHLAHLRRTDAQPPRAPGGARVARGVPAVARAWGTTVTDSHLECYFAVTDSQEGLTYPIAQPGGCLVKDPVSPPRGFLGRPERVMVAMRETRRQSVVLSRGGRFRHGNSQP